MENGALDLILTSHSREWPNAKTIRKLRLRIFFDGALERTRTSDNNFRKVVLYPTELRVHG